MIRINLISGPRNVSTALMYSFAQRPDTRVLDEPYYAVYLLKSGVSHPAKEEILTTLPNVEEEVDKLIFQQTPKDRVLFIKNMAHHIEVLEEEVKTGLINVFLIRDPRQIIASYSRVIKNPEMRDIGIAFQYNLFAKLASEDNTPPCVVDSGLLMENPASVLEQLCHIIGIDFLPSMLYWEPGPKSFDGVWAPFWYDHVHQSTGFVRPAPGVRTIPEGLVSLCEESMAYYQKLLPFAIKP
jgi:Sulfotransferase domain